MESDVNRRLSFFSVIPLHKPKLLAFLRERHFRVCRMKTMGNIVYGFLAFLYLQVSYVAACDLIVPTYSAPGPATFTVRADSPREIPGTSPSTSLVQRRHVPLIKQLSFSLDCISEEFHTGHIRHLVTSRTPESPAPFRILFFSSPSDRAPPLHQGS